MVLNKRRFLFFGAILSLFLGMVGCLPPEEEASALFSWDLQNEDIRKVLDLEYKHAFDSLKLFADHKDPNVRYAVMRAFASFQTPQAEQILTAHLERQYSGSCGNGSLQPWAIEKPGNR